jgi:thiamine-phosphate pyrophosphorylase
VDVILPRTFSLPRLYPIVDAGFLASRGVETEAFAASLLDAGVALLQYRNKSGSSQEVLRNAVLIRKGLHGRTCRLIMNDKPDLAVLSEWDGVHVGQEDMCPEDARRVVGSERLIGVSTHSDAQVRLADLSGADYIAVGPVFTTGTKVDAEPVIGLEGVRRARALTAKPIVAIGGITRTNACSVIDAGADSVAVISALLIEGEPVEKVARDFIEFLR